MTGAGFSFYGGELIQILSFIIGGACFLFLTASVVLILIRRLNQTWLDREWRLAHWQIQSQGIDKHARMKRNQNNGQKAPEVFQTENTQMKPATGITNKVQNGGVPLSPCVEDQLAERARCATLALHECVEVNPNKRGGVPVLKGTRFTVAQLFAEIGEGRGIEEIAEDFELDLETIKELLQGFSIHLDRPMCP